jgi:hypothetical protein
MRKFLTLFAVLVLSCVLAFAQTKVVTGKVTDQQGQPVPFASIRVKGTKQGVSADADGNYTIKVKQGDVLMISGTGLTQKEISVGEGTALNIEVSRQTSNLTEVVVTSLGVQRQSKELGYSTAKISNKEITHKVIDVSMACRERFLVCRLIPQTMVEILLRVVLPGNRSITGNNRPLIVLDGLMISATLINKPRRH